MSTSTTRQGWFSRVQARRDGTSIYENPEKIFVVVTCVTEFGVHPSESCSEKDFVSVGNVIRYVAEGPFLE